MHKEKILFSCNIIGNSSLVNECAEMIHAMNGTIHSIFTDNNQVIQWADQHEIAVFPISFAKNPDAYHQEFDYLLSIYNPIFLPTSIIKLAKKQAINFHNSYLPYYKGFNAPSWAILNNEKELGYTWHVMNNGLDTGDILYQEKVPISDLDTTMSLNLKCFQFAMNRFPEFIQKLMDNNLEPIQQKNIQQKTYHMYHSVYCNGLINWSWSAEEIFRLYRALSFSSFNNTMNTPKCQILKEIFILDEIDIIQSDINIEPGRIIEINDQSLVITTFSNNIEIRKLRDRWGKSIDFNEFITKYSLKIGMNIIEKTCSNDISFEQAIRPIKNNDKFWLSKLLNIKSSDHLLKTLNIDKSSKKEKFLITKFRNDKFIEKVNLIKQLEKNSNFNLLAIVSILIIYLYRVNNYQNINIFLKKIDNNHSLASYFSLTSYAPEFSENDTYIEIYNKLNQGLESQFKEKPFNQDIFYRYKKLNAVDPSSCIHICIDDENQFDGNFDLIYKDIPLYFNVSAKNKILNILHFESASIPVSQISQHLEQLSNDIISNPRKKIYEYELISESEKRILRSFSTTNIKNYSKYKNLSSVFSEMAKQFPNKTAIKDPKNNRTYSYNQLDIFTNKMARILDEIINEASANIGIFLNCQMDTIIAMLSTLKLGKCYVPILSNLPLESFENILIEANPGIMLIDENIDTDYLMLLKKYNITSITFTELKRISFSVSSDEYNAKNSLSDNTYIMYTSGSTGKPKGVMIKASGIIRLVKETNYISINSEDILGQTSSLAFDASTFTVWGALLNGATLVIVDKPTLLDSNALKECIKNEKINILWFTARLLDIHFNNNMEIFSYLKYVVTGGDIVNVKTINALSKFLKNCDCEIINGYGPTENTTFTTAYQINKTKNYKNTVPIGIPITNTNVFILDRHKKPVPIGYVGELYTAGEGIALGYLKKEKLTSERFVEIPKELIDSTDNQLMYKTGDLARWLPDGNIEYIGRQDKQVKVRGFRIELDHLIQSIEKCHHIQKCAVLIENDKIIVFLTTIISQKNDDEMNTIKKNIKSHLPDYMQPSKIIFLNSLPLNRNGKIDNERLRSIYNSKANVNKNNIKCNDAILEKITEIWKRILHINQISPTDNFFDLGGHSLLFLRMLNEINQEFNAKIPVSNLLENPTIKYLHSVIQNKVSNFNEKKCFESMKNDVRYFSKLLAFKQPKIIRNNNAILLTGATGFLGKHLLKDLLVNTSFKVYCLVRNPKKFNTNIFIKNYPKRVVLIKADLSKPKFGLTDFAYETLSKNVNMIIHAAAEVNHIYSYEALRDTNVFGTYEMIYFANYKYKKTLNFISTLSAISVKNIYDEKKEKFPESIDEIYHIHDGYSQTKWVSEYLLKIAHDNGADIKIFRPGWIFGDSRTGSIPQENHLLSIIKSCIQLGEAPDWDCGLHFLPVDFVSSILVKIIFSGNKGKTIFNINNSHQVTWKAIIESLNEYGYPIRMIKLDQWLNQYITNLTPDNALFPFKELYLSNIYNRSKGPDMTVNTQLNNTLEVLHNNGIITPTLNKTLLLKYWSALEKKPSTINEKSASYI